MKSTTAVATISALVAAITLLTPTACMQRHEEPGHVTPAAEAPNLAIAVLRPTAGSSCHGTVRFVQDGDALRVTADIEGLTPGQHAIHVHEYGDCSAPNATSAGSHYNPRGHPHGLPESAERHAGDLGNLEADAAGKAHYEITVTNASIAGLVNPILGRAVIVHERVDDGGQPVGNAGPRVACGVIGIAKPPAAE